MKISIIGTGYVGLVTGVCFSEMGNEVYCVDYDKNKIKNLNGGHCQIYEPGLGELLVNNLNSGRIVFTTDIKKAVEESELCFISVGTPSGEDGSADLKYVIAAATEIGKYINKRMYIIDKSTVPVGTAQKVKQAIEEQLNIRGENFSFDIIANPEFLKEGSAVTDCLRPDRIVIGTESERAEKIMKELYMPFIRNTENFILMDVKSAEMTKYAANAMLATKISFMNEIANICDKVGANVNHVRIGIGSDQRIGYHFIYPGCGYGGSCFPKDVQALISISTQNGYEPQILKAVEEVNLKQKYYLVEQILRKFGDDLKGRTFGVWGMSFKPETNDMREASSITIINELTRRGAKIHATDPTAMVDAEERYLKGNDNVKYFSNKYDAIKNADAMILITEWKEYRSPDFFEMKNVMKYPIIFDGRNQYNLLTLLDIGFEYFQIGVGE